VRVPHPFVFKRVRIFLPRPVSLTILFVRNRAHLLPRQLHAHRFARSVPLRVPHPFVFKRVRIFLPRPASLTVLFVRNPRAQLPPRQLHAYRIARRHALRRAHYVPRGVITNRVAALEHPQRAAFLELHA
jgi:hypothetical protein